jgi:hypothetical protein
MTEMTNSEETDRNIEYGIALIRMLNLKKKTEISHEQFNKL